MQKFSLQQQQYVQEMGVNDLPTAPAVLLECLNAMGQQFDPSKLLNSLKKDPVLYVRALLLISSTQPLNGEKLQALYSTLKLGQVDGLQRLIKATAVECYFDEQQRQQPRHYQHYWQHARTCGLYAEKLALRCGYSFPEEAYLAGLLHNIGQLLHLVRNREDYVDIYLGSSSPLELELFEKEWFGANSAQLGGLLCEAVLQDSFLAEAILFQLETIEALQSCPTLVQIISLASRWSQGNANPGQLYQDIETLLGLNTSECQDIDDLVKQQLVIDHRGVDLVSPGNQEQTEKLFSALGKHIRGMAISESLTPKAHNEEQQLWQVLADNFQVLSGARPLVIFSTEGTQLTPQVVGRNTNHKLLQLRFKGDGVTGSILGQALRTRQVATHSSGDGTVNFIDQQLTHYLQSKHLLAMPLCLADEVKGMLVAGFSSEMGKAFSQQDLLQQFYPVAEATLSLLISTSDISQKRIEHFKTSQSEALRQLIHECANPLGVINNYIEVIKQGTDDESRTRIQLETIRKEINRISRLLNQMRDIDTPVQPEIIPVDINRIIRAQAELFEQGLFNQHHIRCDLELEPNLPELALATESLKQILVNLFKNSVEALKDSGRILVRTRSNVNFNGSLFVEMTISDNGPGIDNSVIKAAFTPVPTQKGASHSGIGLTIVRQLVQELNGYISCQNQSDGGAEFKILLPYQG